MRRVDLRLDRRRFVAGGVGLPVACRAGLAAGGFASGGDRIRVGLIGCGGRGTGAALDAASAATGVSITCLADMFADQIDSSARLLEARAPAAFDCPAGRRFVGPSAWRRALESDVDLVILATPPAFRPQHAAAAVRAGKHVWCEKPGAVDAPGVAVLATAQAEAAARGLSFASGLALRHDPVTAGIVRRIHAGEVGRPLAVTLRADLGLPWFRPPRPEMSPAEAALRNWISHPALSGGPLVEHLIAAIDVALWVLGDAAVATALPGGPAGGARLVLTDGRHIDAAIRRRPRATGAVAHRVHGTAGIRDLRRPATAPHGERHPLRLAMAKLVAAIRSGHRLDDGPGLCRATSAAVAARTALQTGSAVRCDAAPDAANIPA